MENNNRGGFKRGGFGGGNRDGRFGGGRGGFGGGNRGGFAHSTGSGQGDRREVTMHDATCADCHKPCQVPFRPSNDRPVYCNDCFGKNGGSRSKFTEAPRKDFGSRPQNNSGFNKPQTDSSFASNKGNDEIKKQLDTMNAKIDSLIKKIEEMSKAPVAIEKSVATTVKPVQTKVTSQATKSGVKAKKIVKVKKSK